MQYRIVKRKDMVTKNHYYYLECRCHFWNNWYQIATPCTTQESAHKQLELFLAQEEIVRVN